MVLYCCTVRSHPHRRWTETIGTVSHACVRSDVLITIIVHHSHHYWISIGIRIGTMVHSNTRDHSAREEDKRRRSRFWCRLFLNTINALDHLSSSFYSDSFLFATCKGSYPFIWRRREERSNKKKKKSLSSLSLEIRKKEGKKKGESFSLSLSFSLSFSVSSLRKKERDMCSVSNHVFGFSLFQHNQYN